MWGKLSRVETSRGQQGVLSYAGFQHGLNTASPASQIRSTECSELLNWRIQRGGGLVTRDPITKYVTTKITGSVKTFEQLPIDGTNYELLVGSDYKIYYKSALGVPTLIATLEGDAQLIAYNGVVMILDGSYLKYLDGISAAKICYDDGTGTTGYQFDNRAGGDDTGLALGNGTNTRIAYKFTSQTWTAGYTIPPTTVTAVLQRVLDGYTGTDNVNINVVLRLVSDSSVLATKALISAPIEDNVSDTATTYSVTFTSSDITTQMSPGTAYYASLEYNNGDATNYVSVRCQTTTGNAYVYSGSWAADATKNPLMSLRPGKPPKGSFGAVMDRRLFVSGDSSNPGYVWFCNATHLDWSTSDGGGYVGAVDDNKNNYEVGALISLYGDLYVFGTKDQPYLCQLTGSSPSEYSLPALFQRVWSVHKTAMGIGNDAVFASSDGVDNLAGVQEYGDLRSFSISDPVWDRLSDYWSSSTIAGYYPKNGQYLLSMPNHHRVLAFHMQAPTQNPEGIGTRYPISEYEFYLDDLSSSDYKWTSAGSDVYYMQTAAGGDPGFDCTPDAITINDKRITKASTIAGIEDHEWWYGDDDTLGYDTVYFKDVSGDPDVTGLTIKSILIPTCFGAFGGEFYIGASNGYVYKIDQDNYKDMTTLSVNPILRTNYTELPFGHANFTDVQFIATAKGGAGVTVYFYADGSRISSTSTIAFSVYDDLTVDEAVMTVAEATFLVASSTAVLFKPINFNARSVQVLLKNITLAGYPFYLNGLMIKYRMLGT